MSTELLSPLFDSIAPLRDWPALAPGQSIAPEFRSRSNSAKRASVALGAVRALLWLLTSCRGGFSPSGSAWTAYVDGQDDNCEIIAGQGDYWALPEGGEPYLLAIAGLLDAFSRKSTDTDELLIRWKSFSRELRDFLEATRLPLDTVDLPRAAQNTYLNSSLAGLADTLYFYLKLRLGSVKLVYGPPPCTCSENEKFFEAIFGTVEATTRASTSATADDFEAFSQLLSGFSRLSPERRISALDTLNRFCR
ncbi:MAG: hypothetical protein H7Y22_02875 [Gemmatimonadaceae bacterium]|nr:hypothetical protein [Gloeobacterales cyanobacterium ES-bin-141]